MKETAHPLHDQVLVQMIEKSKDGEIVIPEEYRSSIRWKVIAVGPGKVDPDGCLHEVPLEPGDIVIGAGAQAQEIEMNGEKYGLISYKHIRCKFSQSRIVEAVQ